MDAYPFTNAVFNDLAQYRAEQARLFQVWTFVGRRSALPAPDTWFVHDEPARSVVVTRDAHDVLRAFYNVCSHRGAQLCSGQGKGLLKCPYHGWVYGSDGALRGITRPKGLPMVNANTLRLRALEIDDVGGFLFVRDEPRGPSLRQYLGAMAAVLDEIGATTGARFAEMRMDIKADWKIAISGGIEDYHVPFVHRGSFGKVRPERAICQLHDRGHSSFRVPFHPNKHLKAAAELATGGRLADQQDNHLVFPNLLVVRTWTVISTHHMIPVGPGQTLRVSHLYDAYTHDPAWSLRGVAQRAARRVALTVASKVYEEDRQISEIASRGCNVGRAARCGPFHADEQRVEHFMRHVADAVGRISAPGEAQPVSNTSSPTFSSPHHGEPSNVS